MASAARTRSGRNLVIDGSCASALVRGCEGSDLVGCERSSHHDDRANEPLELLRSKVTDALGKFESARLVQRIARESVLELFCY